MLKLENIKKFYKTGSLITKALNGVSVTFREKEFVAILGESGSGKTTMLNVIGGLDTYDEGNLVINGQPTQSFSEADWDAYRNNSIGFVFQSYNLIPHLSVIANVELGMTLSNVSKDQRRQSAEEALAEVGLLAHKDKKPNQLSGGQMQRVAIARALANNPDILLCDEPTGALDSETGIQVLELIKRLSKDRLVIMVTHNAQLARQYADRIIRFHDGRILTDSHPYDDSESINRFNLIKTRMSFGTALQLSFNNLRTKVGATTLTSFAASIGIISIAVVLALSNGFQQEINATQQEALAQFPITISPVANDPEAFSNFSPLDEYPDIDDVIVTESPQEQAAHYNNLTQEYLDYIQAIDPNLSNNIGYGRMVELNLIREIDGEFQSVQFSSNSQNDDPQAFASQQIAQTTGVGVSTFPETINQEQNVYLENNYDLLAGDFPSNVSDIILVTENDNSININSLNNLGFDVKDGNVIPFNELIGTEIKLVPNDIYYEKLPTGTFVPNDNFNNMAEDGRTNTLTIKGIIRPKENSGTAILSSGIAYSDELNRIFIDNNENSDIVQAQIENNQNVFTGETIDNQTQQSLITTLGGEGIPSSIYIYPNDFESKDEIVDYLNAYNVDLAQENQIIFTDLASAISEMTGSLLNGITIALVAFSAISLITTIIMIGIITYNSVIQRTKEIGILKALGARKRDITRVFDAENFILGILSGLFGVGAAYLLTLPINNFIENLTGISNVAKLNSYHAVILVLIAVLIHLVGGHIPARMAAQQNAADALRSE